MNPKPTDMMIPARAALADDVDRSIRELGRTFRRPETDTFAASVAFFRRLDEMVAEAQP